MDGVPDQKSLAAVVLDAIRRGDAALLRRCLDQGALPDGWWDPVEGAARYRQTIEMFGRHATLPDESNPRTDSPPDIDAMMLATFGGECTAPGAHEIPLHLAAGRGALDCMHALLEAGADINRRDSAGASALFRAGTPEAARALIIAGIDVHAVNRFGNDVLQERLSEATGPDDDPAGIDRDLALCRAMLDGGVPLRIEIRGRSRLYHAAFAEHLHGVRFLLAAGHPIDADTGHTALHAICWHWDYNDPRDANTRGG